ncbi:hypothetical protein GOP47_0028946 [Adiantum capillus-veneris]|nr:hypothetical protein GOP47_0028946 [Adiantum capillus-veneris]
MSTRRRFFCAPSSMRRRALVALFPPAVRAGFASCASIAAVERRAVSACCPCLAISLRSAFRTANTQVNSRQGQLMAGKNALDLVVVLEEGEVVTKSLMVREESLVTDEIKATWGPLWNEINDEFKCELKKKPKFQVLVNHMFYVWEGNHRTVAWTEANKERFSTSKEKHCRVLCTIIDPTKVLEIALLSSLQRMKLSCDVLKRLVYDIQMTKEKEKRMSNVKHGLSDEDFKKEEERIHQEITHKYQDRIGKLLNIVDPNLGTDWLARVLSLKWGSDSWATLEKLNLIALQDAPVQNKIHWISLLEADKITRGTYGLKKGVHVFRIEGFLARVFERAFQTVSDLMDVPGVVPLPHDSTLTFYFEEIKFEARPILFPIEVSLGAKTKDVEKQALKKVDTLQMAAQRLSFRFLMFLVSKNVLPAMPFLARQWTQMATQDTCMYPSSMRTLSAWEIENCLWWMDMEKGHVLGRERELHDTMSRDAVIQNPPAADRREVRHADMRNSQKEKETFVDTIIEEDVGSRLVSSGTIMARKTISFIYLVEKRSREDPSTSLDIDDEGDMPSRVNPFDD